MTEFKVFNNIFTVPRHFLSIFPVCRLLGCSSHAQRVSRSTLQPNSRIFWNPRFYACVR